MGGTRNGPRPSWEGLPPEKREYLEDQRERWWRERSEAKKLAKLEAFAEIHKERAAHFFEDKINFINAMIEGVRDPESHEIDPSLVQRMDARDKKILMDAFAQVEKSAGFAQTTTTHKHTHTLTLADQFKELQSGDEDEVIDAEVVDD